MLKEGIAARPQAVRKFLREARTAARLNNPHVVAVYDAGQEKEIVFLVMELMEGGSAHDRIAKWGPFGWLEASQVMASACKGLAAVHTAGLIHRDIKPSNIMRAADGTVKLADFGLALTVAGTSDSSTHHGHVVGTPLYMSPEQCRGKTVDPRSDIYAMGATYYSLLTGLPPFDGKSSVDIMWGHCRGSIPDPCAVVAGIPAGCAELVRRTMAKDPAARPADADALIEDFQRIMQLATSPDIKLLDWAANGGTRVTTASLPPAMSTAMEAITPLSMEDAPPKSRIGLWFAGICVLLMGVAFAVGYHLSQPAAPIASSPTTATSRNEAKEPKRDPIVPKTPPIEAGSKVTSLAFDPSNSAVLSWCTQNGAQIFDHQRRQQHFKEWLAGVSLSNTRQVAYSPNRNGHFWAVLVDIEIQFFSVDENKA